MAHRAGDLQEKRAKDEFSDPPMDRVGTDRPGAPPSSGRGKRSREDGEHSYRFMSSDMNLG